MNFDDFKYCVVIRDKLDDIIHMVGYPSEPSEQEIDSLRHEIAIDPDIKFYGSPDDLKFFEANEEEYLQYYMLLYDICSKESENEK